MLRIKSVRNISLEQKRNILNLEKPLSGNFKIHAGRGVFLIAPYKLSINDVRLTQSTVKIVLTIEVRLFSFLIALSIVFFSAFCLAFSIYSSYLLLFPFVIPIFIIYAMYYNSAFSLAEKKLDRICKI
jgi:hypothetical protein